MFLYERLKVYQKSKDTFIELAKWIKQHAYQDASLKQLYRASLSISLNIAEGSSRYTNADKRRFFVIARGSAFETSALISILEELNQMDTQTATHFKKRYETISVILYTLINNLNEK